MVIARRHLERSRGNQPVSIGPYAVERQLLEAGTGPVYLGRDPEGGQVVIKVISAAFARDHDFRRRLRADLETVRALAPPCLADIIDADTSAHPPYVVTEFVDAPTLAATVAQGGPLAVPDVRRLAVALGSALTGLHGAGLVFGDLKPANVVLFEGGIRLVDFGLSRVLNTVALPGRSGSGPGMGTPAFITPEHVLRQPLTMASDIFTWGGAVLFAATGRLPFGNGSPQVLLQRAVYAEPDLTGLDPVLRDVVSATMRKDPSRRPGAAELLEVLGRLVGGLPAPTGLDPLELAVAAAVSAAAPPTETPAAPPDEMSAVEAPADTAGVVPAAAVAVAEAAEAAEPAPVPASAPDAAVAPDPTPDSDAEPAPEPEAKVEPEAKAESEPTAKSEARPEPESGPGAGTGAAASAAAEPGIGGPSAQRSEAAQPSELSEPTAPAAPADGRRRPDGHWLFRLFMAGIASLAVLTMAVEITGAVRAQAAVRASKATAGQARALLERQPDLAGQLAAAAYEIAPTAAAGEALIAAAVRRSGHLPGDVRDLAVAPDGSSIVTAGDTGAGLWNLTDPSANRRITAFPVDGPAVSAVGYVSPPGRTTAAGQIIVTAAGPAGAGESKVQLWRVTPDDAVERLGVLAGHTGTVGEIAVSRAGDAIATGSSDGMLRLWDVTDPRAPAELAVLRTPGPITALAFSPGGDQILVGGAARLSLWSLHDPRQPRRQGLLHGEGVVAGASYSPDGRTLAVATTGLPDAATEPGSTAGVPMAVASSLAPPEKSRSVVEIYRQGDPRGLHRLTSFAPASGAGMVAFSPDGRALAVAAAAGGGDVGVWDMSNPARPRPRLTLPTPAAPSDSAGPSDLAALAIAGSAPASPEPAALESATPRPAALAPTALAFAGGPARTLAVADGNGARVWDLDPRTARDQVCGRAQVEITRRDWRRYIPDRHYSPPCPRN